GRKVRRIGAADGEDRAVGGAARAYADSLDVVAAAPARVRGQRQTAGRRPLRDIPVPEAGIARVAGSREAGALGRATSDVRIAVAIGRHAGNVVLAAG